MYAGTQSTAVALLLLLLPRATVVTLLVQRQSLQQHFVTILVNVWLLLLLHLLMLLQLLLLHVLLLQLYLQASIETARHLGHVSDGHATTRRDSHDGWVCLIETAVGLQKVLARRSKLRLHERRGTLRAPSHIDNFLSQLGLTFTKRLRRLFNGFLIANITPRSLVAVLFQESALLFPNGRHNGTGDLELFRLETGNVETLVEIHQATVGLIARVTERRASASAQDVAVLRVRHVLHDLGYSILIILLLAVSGGGVVVVVRRSGVDFRHYAVTVACLAWL
jgi:hypothetical protein